MSEIKYTRAFSFICSKQLSIKKQTITHRDSIDEGGGVDLENNDQGSSSSIGLDLNWTEKGEKPSPVRIKADESDQDFEGKILSGSNPPNCDEIHGGGKIPSLFDCNPDFSDWNPGWKVMQLEVGAYESNLVGNRDDEDKSGSVEVKAAVKAEEGESFEEDAKRCALETGVTKDEMENSALQESDQLADDHSSEENNNKMPTCTGGVHPAVCPYGDEVQAQSCSEAAIAKIEVIEENGGKLMEPKSDRHENLQERIQHAVPGEMIEQGEMALITNGEKTPEQPDENTSMAREKIANMKTSFKSAEKSEEDEGSSENEVNVSDGGLGKEDERQRQEVMEELEKEYDENLREEIIKNISKRLETENAGVQEDSEKSPGQSELETKASEHVGEFRSKEDE